MTENTLSTVMAARFKYKDNKSMNKLGEQMFTMYTDLGLPPDIFLAEVSKKQELDILAKVYITGVYQGLFLEHRRKSGIQEKNIDKIRKQNLESIDRLISSGEIGVY